MKSDNMSVATRVVKNSSLLLFASIINNIMSFILTLFTARYLGTYNFGLISSANSLVGVFGIFCDLGLSTYAIREVSRNNELTDFYFGTTLVFRILFTVITFIVYALFVINSNFTQEGINVMILFGIYMIFNSFVLFFYSLFQSNENMQYQTIGNAIYSISVLLIILIMIFDNCNVTIVAAGYPIAMFLSLLYSLYITVKYYPRFKLCRKPKFIKKLFIKGIPFGITAVFTSIYFWIALIVLTFLSGSVAVGLFSSSQKLLLVVAAIFTLLSNAVFPVMSELFTVDKEKLAHLFHKLLKFMLMIGLPMAIGCFIFDTEIINIIYGAEYLEGAITLSILIWAGVFMLLSGMCSTLLGSINKQFTVTKIAAIGAIVSIILNCILISLYSYIGASISTVFTEFIILFMMMSVISRTEFKLPVKKAVLPVIQIIIASLIMGVCLILLNQPFLVSFPLAIIIYVIALFVTRAINKEDREIILDMINQLRNKI
ncbi:MAG: flippase [Methanosphaera stadtmanae]|nr:flippase [Methanosphaera stadtmanae]